MEPYVRNLLKLLDQEEKWENLKMVAFQKGDQTKVSEVESKYLTGIRRKISQLLERAPSYE